MATYTFDAWKDKSPEELKADCRRLSRALLEWQNIALHLAGGDELSDDQRQKLQNLIAAWQD